MDVHMKKYPSQPISSAMQGLLCLGQTKYPSTLGSWMKVAATDIHQNNQSGLLISSKMK
jgi:hypothetical protein